MSNIGEPIDWDDDSDPVNMEEEYHMDDDEEGTSLEDFKRLVHQERIITRFVDEAYMFGGAATIADVLNNIDRKMGWRTEIIGEASALDDTMLFVYNSFNPDAWDLWTNSDENMKLRLDVAYEASIAMRQFAQKLTGNTTTKGRFRLLGRSIAQKLMRFFD
jgi:hypothetical protein